MAVTHLGIPCVAHGKLHETCMFHATRKHGPHKHVTGMHCSFLVAPRVDTCVEMKLRIIEWYRMIVLANLIRLYQLLNVLI